MSNSDKVNFLDPLSKHRNKSPHVLPNQQLEFISYMLETKSPTIVGYYVSNPGKKKVVMITIFYSITIYNL